MTESRPVVLWFRRDLRLRDHPALVAAADAGPVVPLFVVDPALAGTSANRRAHLARSLRRRAGPSGRGGPGPRPARAHRFAVRRRARADPHRHRVALPGVHAVPAGLGRRRRARPPRCTAGRRYWTAASTTTPPTATGRTCRGPRGSPSPCGSASCIPAPCWPTWRGTAATGLVRSGRSWPGGSSTPTGCGTTRRPSGSRCGRRSPAWTTTSPARPTAPGVPELDTPGYPAPVVDHAVERREALARLTSLDSSDRTGRMGT